VSLREVRAKQTLDMDVSNSNLDRAFQQFEGIQFDELKYYVMEIEGEDGNYDGGGEKMNPICMTYFFSKSTEVTKYAKRWNALTVSRKPIPHGKPLRRFSPITVGFSH